MMPAREDTVQRRRVVKAAVAEGVDRLSGRLIISSRYSQVNIQAALCVSQSRAQQGEQ